MHIFVGQARAIADVKKTHYARIGLDSCLHGVAQEWYAAELDDIQRDGLQSFHDTTNWATELTAQLKQSEQVALDALLTHRYRLADIWSERSPV